MTAREELGWCPPPPPPPSPTLFSPIVPGNLARRLQREEEEEEGEREENCKFRPSILLHGFLEKKKRDRERKGRTVKIRKRHLMRETS